MVMIAVGYCADSDLDDSCKIKNQRLSPPATDHRLTELAYGLLPSVSPLITPT
jgi:hypothetical protein